MSKFCDGGTDTRAWFHCVYTNAFTECGESPNVRLDQIFAQWDKPDKARCVVAVIEG